MLSFHRHKYGEPIGEHMVALTYNLDGSRVGKEAPITIVTDRCACGKLRQQTLEGSISAESLGFLVDRV